MGQRESERRVIDDERGDLKGVRRGFRGSEVVMFRGGGDFEALREQRKA